jgi:ATP-dependent protease HslVU (ClpYQ) peptidase subunit
VVDEVLWVLKEIRLGWMQAVMVVADAEVSLTITGNGDVLEPYDGVIGIGSGGSYALAAARALLDLPDMDAETIGQCAWFLTSIPLLTYGNSLKGLSGIVMHAVS